MHPMSSEVRRNDLEMYEPVTEMDGPAMTWVRRGAKPKLGFIHEVVVSIGVIHCQPRQQARFVRPALNSKGTWTVQSERCVLKMPTLGQRDASRGVTLKLLLYCHPWGRQQLVKGHFSLLQSMFAVGWLELKEVQRAQSQLNKCFSNITEPFKVSGVAWCGCFPVTNASCFYLACSQVGHITLGDITQTGACADCTCGH